VEYPEPNPRQLFEKNKPSLDSLQTRLVKSLEEDGIVATSLDELFPDKNLLSELQRYTQSLEGSAESKTKKLFLKHFWDVNAELDFNNPFVRIATDKRVVDIANSYMQMWTKLKYYTLLKTVPVFGEEAKQSQRWHRDPEEKRMCKMFIYLTDVNEESGPFIYIPKSVYGKKYGHLFPQRPPEGVYPKEGAVEKAIPKEAVKVFTGKAGTVLFCDTTGIHRGGYAKSKPRIMFTSFYAAPSFNTEQIRYPIPENLKEKVSKLPLEVSYALKE